MHSKFGRCENFFADWPVVLWYVTQFLDSSLAWLTDREGLHIDWVLFSRTFIYLSRDSSALITFERFSDPPTRPTLQTNYTTKSPSPKHDCW